MKHVSARSLAATAVAGAALLASAAPALAHTEVRKLTPQPGSTVARSTAKVSLRFSEAVVGGSIKVTDKRGRTVSSGSRLIKGKTGLRAKLTLHAGRFTVKATWIADDGDTQTKTWRFKSR